MHSKERERESGKGVGNEVLKSCLSGNGSGNSSSTENLKLLQCAKDRIGCWKTRIWYKSISSYKKIHHREMMGEEDRKGKKICMLVDRQAQEGPKGG